MDLQEIAFIAFKIGITLVVLCLFPGAYIFTELVPNPRGVLALLSWVMLIGWIAGIILIVCSGLVALWSIRS